MTEILKDMQNMFSLLCWVVLAALVYLSLLQLRGGIQDILFARKVEKTSSQVLNISPMQDVAAQDWREEAARCRNDELQLQRFEAPPKRRVAAAEPVLHHPTFYAGKQMDWSPTALAMCDDLELVEPLLFETQRR